MLRSEHQILNVNNDIDSAATVKDLDSPATEIVCVMDKVQDSISHLRTLLRFPELAAKLENQLVARRRSAVRMVLRIRDKREQLIGSGLFSDPAWDILLDAYASELENRRMSVSDICIAARAPLTTGSRWLRILESRDLLKREDDAKDRRRSYIRLTDRGRIAIEQLADEFISSSLFGVR